MRYAKNQQAATSNGHFDFERKRQEEINSRLMKSEGTENPFRLWRELGELMTKDCTVIRYNKNLVQTDTKLVELLERFQRINLSDRSMWANTSFAFTRELYNMLQLSRVIAQGAGMRDESRGAHYKPDFPERDDKNWLKTTKAYFAPEAEV
jgi:succinate dehydrogenase / fumarate reductase flavoprotein subunit